MGSIRVVLDLDPRQLRFYAEEAARYGVSIEAWIAEKAADALIVKWARQRKGE